MESKRPDDVSQARQLIRALLSPADPGDALTSYYALWHDARRTKLLLHRDLDGRVDGFLTVSQTGADLFRPLVTVRAPSEVAVVQMLRSALAPGLAFRAVVPAKHVPSLHEACDVSLGSLTHIYRLDASRFQPVVNVLVQRVAGADGAPRFQIEAQGQLVAMSGTNWRSPSFAEVFVFVHPAGRGRGWGRSVVSACTAELLEQHLQPLYTVEQDNTASIHIAQALGYVDTGLHDYSADCRLRQP